MTIETAYFKNCKKAGRVTKRPDKAWFSDGLCHKERALWHNDADNRDYVILNGEAHPFTEYSFGGKIPGVVRGFI